MEAKVKIMFYIADSIVRYGKGVKDMTPTLNLETMLKECIYMY